MARLTATCRSAGFDLATALYVIALVGHDHHATKAQRLRVAVVPRNRDRPDAQMLEARSGDAREEQLFIAISSRRRLRLFVLPPTMNRDLTMLRNHVFAPPIKA
jgi:hypothetical protein